MTVSWRVKKAIQEGTTQEQQKIEWSGGYRRVEELRIHWITVLQGLKRKNASSGCREGNRRRGLVHQQYRGKANT